MTFGQRKKCVASLCLILILKFKLNLVVDFWQMSMFVYGAIG